MTKYVYNKLNSINEIGAWDLIGAANRGIDGLSQFNMAAGLLFSSTAALASLKKKHDWDSRGCDRIVDPIQRAQCEARQLDKLIAGIRTQMKFCKNSKDTQKCEQQLYDEVNKLNEKKKQIFSTTISTEQ